MLLRLTRKAELNEQRDYCGGYPENCGCCILRDLVGYCINGKNAVGYSNRNNKPDWCPIEPIPEGIDKVYIGRVERK